MCCVLPAALNALMRLEPARPNDRRWTFPVKHKLQQIETKLRSVYRRPLDTLPKNSANMLNDTLVLLSFIRWGVTAWHRVISMANRLHLICWQSVSSGGTHTTASAAAAAATPPLAIYNHHWRWRELCVCVCWCGVLAAASESDGPTADWPDQPRSTIPTDHFASWAEESVLSTTDRNSDLPGSAEQMFSSSHLFLFEKMCTEICVLFV